MLIKKVETFRDAVFVVTRDQECPLYNVGDEFKVEHIQVASISYKPVCFFLMEKLKEISARKSDSGRFVNPHSQQTTVYDCGGCEDGSINFVYKKDKAFVTLQMKLLKDAKAKQQQRHLDKFYAPLRKLTFFESLDDDALVDLTLLLELRAIPVNKLVIKKGEPGRYLFIILSGKVAVMGDEGERIAEIGRGEIFGEMSLLSGEPITRSIHTIAKTQVVRLSRKNFQYVMKKYPILQIFLLRLLMKRAQTMTLHSGQITSGMSGELSEIKTVDLLQLINSTQKTGTLILTLETGRGTVSFNQGEVVNARFLDQADKEALFTLLGINSGHFSYDKGIAPELEGLPPIGGFMGMLMEGLQRMDEVDEE